MPLTAERREALEITPPGSSLLWWTDGDAEDPSDGINVLDADTARNLADESTEAIIDKVIAHYEQLGRDDGHPAYALFAHRNLR